MPIGDTRNVKSYCHAIEDIDLRNICLAEISGHNPPKLANTFVRNTQRPAVLK